MNPICWTGSAAGFSGSRSNAVPICVELRVLAAQYQNEFVARTTSDSAYIGELKFTIRGRCTLDRIKMNPSFGPVPRLLFKFRGCFSDSRSNPITLYCPARSRCTVETKFLALTTS